MNLAVIAWNTFREAVRDRVLYNLVFFALLQIAAAVLVGQVSIGIERLIIVNLGLSAISAFGVVMATFLGVGLIYKEMERRTLYSVLSKPIERWQFISGKYAGLCLTLTVNTFFMTLGLAVALLYVQRSLYAADFAVLLGAGFILLELYLLTALALFFSTFATPMVSTLGALGLYLVGKFAEDIRAFGQMSESPALETFTSTLYLLLPNFSLFDIIGTVAHGRPVPAVLVIANLWYAALYITIAVLAAVTVFSNRNLK
jgi:ABC-type transport system involved in multi-copper enzyme maturation permease subunit